MALTLMSLSEILALTNKVRISVNENWQNSRLNTSTPTPECKSRQHGNFGQSMQQVGRLFSFLFIHVDGD